MSPIKATCSSLNLISTPTIWLVRSSPGISCLLNAYPKYSALQSNMTLIFPGLAQWYTPWCGMYHLLPSDAFGDFSAYPFWNNLPWNCCNLWRSFHPSWTFSSNLVTSFLLVSCCLANVAQWTHLRRFTIDSMSKFHVESSWKLHRFWKTNPRGNYDIDSTWIFWRGFNFQNRRIIDEFSTWIFLCRFDVKST